MGQIIALSIFIWWAGGCVFFAQVVVDCLFGGISTVNPLVEDVPDEDLQWKIRKVF